MSCQQVPRLVEDPYTFTDTPATSAFFTTPIQKLTSTKSASAHLSKSQPNRYNGHVATVNGYSSNHHTPIYAKQPIYKQQQQHTQPTPSAKVAKPLPASALPPPPFYASTKNSFLNHSNAKCVANATVAVATTKPPNAVPMLVLQTSKQSSRAMPFKQPNGQHFGAPRVRSDHNNTFDSSISINGRGGTSATSNGIGGGGVGFGGNTGKTKKNSATTNPRTFVKPKAETKVFIGKRLTTVGKPLAIGKTKRSYGQNSHHEQMQRISSDNVPIVVRPGARKAKQTNFQQEWHAPDVFMYIDSNENDAEQAEMTRCAQSFWFKDIPNEVYLTREQRLEIKRDNLRRQAVQYAQSQNFRSTNAAKKRLMSINKALYKFTKEREKKTKTCRMASCANDALAMTAYCYLHITLSSDQKLFHPCTAKFSDNSQCRVPVFDISHELPLCREHAWKRDNYNRMLQDKPKKMPRKKSKPIAMTRPHKRNKRKKKALPAPVPLQQAPVVTLPTPPAPVVEPVLPSPPQSQLLQLPQPQLQLQPQQQLQHLPLPSMHTDTHLTRSLESIFSDDAILSSDTHGNSEITSKVPVSLAMANQFLSDNSTIFQYAQTANDLACLQQQELFTVCENSSAYESSEDTGVGGLSESELMGASDGIEIPYGDTRLLEEHDLTNVLELPDDAFQELFEVQQNEPYEPSQKEQDELARALKEVDEQVKSLEQMTSASDFLDIFHDVDDEILADSNDAVGDMLTSSMKKFRGLLHT